MLIIGISYVVIGMSVVFLFLIIQVFLMKIMSAIILKYFPEKEEKNIIKNPIKKDMDIIAVIAAAVKNYEIVNN